MTYQMFKTDPTQEEITSLSENEVFANAAAAIEETINQLDSLESEIYWQLNEENGTIELLDQSGKIYFTSEIGCEGEPETNLIDTAKEIDRLITAKNELDSSYLDVWVDVKNELGQPYLQLFHYTVVNNTGDYRVFDEWALRFIFPTFPELKSFAKAIARVYKK